MTIQLQELDLIYTNEVLILSFHDSRLLEDGKIHAIGKEMIASLPKAKQGRLVVDFDGVDIMSSAMIGKLVLLHRKCKASDIRMQVSRISDTIMDVFKVARLDKLFEFYSDEDPDRLLEM